MAAPSSITAPTAGAVRHVTGKSRLTGLGIDGDVEAAYETLLSHRGWTAGQLAEFLALETSALDQVVRRLTELGLVETHGTALDAVDPEVGLSALAAKLESELAERQQQLEMGRVAISELVAGLDRPASRSSQLTDVVWGAHDVSARITQLLKAASSEVVAMSTAHAQAVDDTLLPGLQSPDVCYRFVFAPVERRDHHWNRWVEDLVDHGAEVRTGVVPTPAIIIDGTTVALPICDPASGQIVGLATLRLPIAVTAVVELFERVWAEARVTDNADADHSGLCARERELLALLVSGITDESAAGKLGVSVRTVRRMVSDLMQRLGARSRFEAGARAVERGWLRLSTESH